MKVLGLMLVLLAFNTYAAEIFVTRIHSVDGDLIKFQNARVGHNYRPQFVESMTPGDLVKVTVTDHGRLIGLEKLEDLEVPNAINSPFTDTDYHPTVLRSSLELQNLLHQMRGDF